MNTRVLMAGSAVVMAAAGVVLQFAPHEVLTAFTSAPAPGAAALLAQVAGALYLGFALLNWMARSILIGGIYARPVAVGNLLHFLAGALALGKQAPAVGSSLLWVFTGVYTLLAALFGWVTFTHPKAKLAAGK